ncbi:MAG TPA: alkaline phosphatase family protein [Acidimicrobiales bacterium]|nr:alkaline phosphatase family protein [Acidimicrobiales bacterium]
MSEPLNGRDRSDPPPSPALSRRRFLAAGAGTLVAGVVGSQLGPARPAAAVANPVSSLTPVHKQALAALGKTSLRMPGSLPFPKLPPGTDTLPEIEHIVVCMLENHSYDNLFGMLGRGPGQLRRGDGFVIDDPTPTPINPYGTPTFTNPYANGDVQLAFHMPSTCQNTGGPGQEWKTSHVSYAGGACNGFVESDSGPVSMGYWTGADLPFTYALAETFPIGDRWFCSLLGQTDPNRRFLIAATAMGMTDDVGTSIGNVIPDVNLALPPPGGTIFDILSDYGISWLDYAESYPLGCTAALYPVDDVAALAANTPIKQFFTNCAAGKLPKFCIVDMNYDTQSQENPQNIVVGETFLASVVKAIGSSPNWEKTMLIITYDEHGGYFDHVPPPVALAPDLIPPFVQPGESTYEGFNRYGFRVPSVVVSPYAKPNYVSHQVYDHTSILAMVERKWNLPALTYRDANANDLMDFLDVGAMQRGTPTFTPSIIAALPPSGENSRSLACSAQGPAKMPPPGSVRSHPH